MADPLENPEAGDAVGSLTSPEFCSIMPWSSSARVSLVVLGVALVDSGACDSARPLVPARLEFVAGPAASTPSQLPLGPVRVDVMTADGQLATSASASVTVSLVGSDTGAHLVGTTTVQAVQGTATFPDLSIARAGSDFRLVARVAGLDSGVSSPFAISAGPASRLSFDPIRPALATAGSSITLVVRATDAAGNVAPASTPVTVGFTRVGSLGATTAPDGIFGSTTAPLVNGVATFAGINFHKSGIYTLSASAAPLTAATSGQLTVQNGPMTQLAFVSQPPNGSTNVALPAFSVQQFDQFGNALSLPPGPEYTVTLSLGASPAGATIHGTVTRTVFGATPATFDDIVLDKQGTGYTLVATSGTISVTSAPFTIQ